MENTFNAKITDASITMANHGCLTWYLVLEGAYCVNFGGYCIGHGYLGAEAFEGSTTGTESIMRIMDMVGVERWEDLVGHYVRVVDPGWGNTVTTIGNIIKDKWFDCREFFSHKEE